MEAVYAFIDSILPFGWLQYDFMKNALIAVLLIAPLLGILGTMAVNNNMAFFSDAIGHSAITGIALGVLLGMNNYLLSTLAFAVLIAFAITRVKRSSMSSADTIISVFSSAATALGLVILSQGGGFARYSSYLVGDILSVSKSDILSLLIVFVVIIVIWVLIYNKLLLLTINAPLARSRGVKGALIENIFVLMVAVVVMLSIKWVGILLINSMLILPAATARNIAPSSRRYQLYSVIISLFSGVTGLIISYYFNTAAGATITLISALLFFISLLAGRKLRE